MSHAQLETLWVFIVGTGALLALTISLLTMLLLHDRRMQAAERERLAAATAMARDYQALADHSPDIILRLGGEGSIRLANARGAELFRLDQGPPGPSTAGWYHWLTLAIQAQQAGQAQSAEFSEGGRIFEVRAIPEPGGASLLLVGRDLTVERSLQAALHQSQKLEALGTLVGGVSHEFNNLLMAVLGAAQTLQLRLASAEDRHGEALAVILDAARRGKEVAGQLLNFSRRVEPQCRPSTLRAVVEGMEGLMDVVLKGGQRSIVLRREFQDDLAALRVDPDLLGQAVLNLVVNARDALPGEGWIRIRTGSRSLGREEGVLLGVAEGSYQFIEVADSGRGVPPELRERIFEPFFTTKPAGEGTGLGLAVLHGIVRGHGGAVLVEDGPKDDGPGPGAAFSILLPED